MNGFVGWRSFHPSAQSAPAPTGIKPEGRGKMLSQERVRELLDYNPETGELVWKVSTGSRARVGAPAGALRPDGYKATMIDKRLCLNHRLIWFYTHGYFSENQIDHVNRDKSDNRLSNLREVSHSCNIRNSKQLATNTSGVQGVWWHREGRKWCTEIYADKKRYLGLHSSFLEAVCHRLAAEQCLGWGSCDSNSPAYQYVRENLNGK
jgi:hypothetical protein